MADYKLSATLEGHTSDIRAVLFPDPSAVVTASRDGTSKLWNRTSSSPPTYDDVELSNGATYKTSLAYMKPSNEYPSGLFFIGGQDTVIEARQPGTSAESNAEAIMVGHGHQISSLDVNSKAGWIVSGSWDSTARLWQVGKWECETVLEGHEGSVWAVLAFSEDIVVTGCADKGIRVFDLRGKLISLFDGKDVVRALCKLPENHPSGAQIASATNDGVIRFWTLDGKLVSELHGHESYIYSLAVLPSGEIVSSGEDRTLRIWRGNECVQVVTHPAISVWSVAVCAQNGDLITGASDKMARVFSRDSERQATPEEIKQFIEALSSSAIPQQTVSEDIPSHPPEFLQQKSGTKEGQVVIIRNPDGSQTAHQWSTSAQTWLSMGSVVDNAGSGGKTEYQGQQYDYVFTVDIEDGKPPLKLPYNRSQNPYDAATKFLQDNEQPMSYLEQTANFIVENTKGATIGQDAGPAPVGSDPWGSESRYRPGEVQSSSAPKSASTPTVPLRPTEYVPLASMNVKGVAKKVFELNEKRQSSDAEFSLSAAELEYLKELFKQFEQLGPSSGDLEPTPALQASLPVLVKMATTWTPPADRLAALDVLRVLCLKTPELAKHDFDGQTLVGVVLASGAFDAPAVASAPNVCMTAVRTFSNLYCTESGRTLIAAEHTFDNILTQVKNVTMSKASSPHIVLATATYYLNTAIFLTAPDNSRQPESFERGLLVIEAAVKMLDGIHIEARVTGDDLKNRSEPIRRLLHAVGTLLIALGEGEIKSVADEVYELTRVLDGLKSRGITRDPRIPPLISQIKAALR